ncbi:PRD domain/PTS system IIA domain-containing protein [Streptococcus varani]|uniref:PRD domain/PTS system IIA domain-containing protein n=1 Tax=Streptococcus varani TaxID=1608583 RepID=A0A0E4CRP8_9STRE|nr:BglG family transcription antiterminator [Streptococcus varani]CQR23742.1 PRD domain/PTS system IIA domain-containing protein [Streptococcus varani]
MGHVRKNGGGIDLNTRQFSVLQDLVSASDYITGQALSEKYGVSTKTIYSDIAIINEKLTAFRVEIEKKPRLGVQLTLTPAKRRKILDFLEQSSLEVADEGSQILREYELIKELVLDGKSIDIMDWSVEHFISEASIRRDLDKIEPRLKPYQLQMIRGGGCVSIEGREDDIRKFLRNYIIQNFDLENNQLPQDSGLTIFFPLDKIETVVNIVQNCANAYNFRLAESYSIYLVLDLLISAHRYLQNNLILENVSPLILVEDLPQYEVYVIASELISKTTGVLMNLIPDSEIRNISYTLLSVGYEPKLAEHPDMKKSVEIFIKRVSKLSGVDFTEDSHLYNMLVNHVQPMIYRLKSGINIKNQTTEEIKTKYSVLYYVVWLASKTLSEEYKVDFLDAEIAFLTIYFEVAVEKLIKPLTICVICPHGLATSELIMSSLKRIISSFDHIIQIDLRDLVSKKEMLSRADLVVSSVRLEKVNFDYIHVNPIMTASELELIQRTYSELTTGNRNMLSVIHEDGVFAKSVVLDLLQENILLGQSCKTVEECIELMVSKASKKNRKDEKLLTSILAREKMGPTSVYTGIALPHADPTFVNESQLIMMTLKKPIKWGSNTIKVIMLIAIAEKDEELYKKALVSLYSKIDKHDYIDSLWKADKKVKFIEEL